MKRKTPFAQWMDNEGMKVPEFVELAKARGVLTATPNTIYKARRFNPETKKPVIPRNRKYYEAAFPGIKF